MLENEGKKKQTKGKERNIRLDWIMQRLYYIQRIHWFHMSCCCALPTEGPPLAFYCCPCPWPALKITHGASCSRFPPASTPCRFSSKAYQKRLGWTQSRPGSQVASDLSDSDHAQLQFVPTWANVCGYVFGRGLVVGRVGSDWWARVVIRKHSEHVGWFML